jgi:AraC family ethanolamine operon transcriptional activator
VPALDATFDDVDLMCEAVRTWDIEFQPLAAGPNGSGLGRIVQSEAGRALLGHARFRAPLEQTGSSPPGFVTFVIQEPGMRGLWWRGHDVDADTVLAFPIGGELSCISGSDFDVHTISVSEEALAHAAMALELELPAPGQRAEVFDVPKALLDPIRVRQRLVREGRFMTTQADVTEILMTLLPSWVLRAGQGRRFRPASGARDRAIRMSLELMEANRLAELRPAQLRAYSGVSERTLQYAFRDRFGLTPAAFIKARRLAAVRAMLCSADPHRTHVGDVLGDFGFWHLGQFAKDYRQTFGELPSDTLGRTRVGIRGGQMTHGRVFS